MCLIERSQVRLLLEVSEPDALYTARRGLCVDTSRDQDVFATELRGVTVVMPFLSPRFNLKLRSKLERELAPGRELHRPCARRLVAGAAPNVGGGLLASIQILSTVVVDIKPGKELGAERYFLSSRHG